MTLSTSSIGAHLPTICLTNRQGAHWGETMTANECRTLREAIARELDVARLLIELLAAHGLAVRLNGMLAAVDEGGVLAAATWRQPA
jgi:hypothetical protein